MTWPAAQDAAQQDPWRFDHKAIGWLRIRVFLAGSAFSVFSGALIVGLTAVLVWQAFQTLDAFRAAGRDDATIEFGDFAANRPDLLALSIGIAVLGAVTAAAGVWLLGWVLGPDRRPPSSTVVLIGVFPLPFFALCTLMAIPSGLLFVALSGGPMLALWCWLLPMELVVLAVGQLTIACGAARQRQVFVETSALPRKAVDYFDETEPAMLEAGLDPVGDIKYTFAAGKCRRLWANPNRTFFASACWFPCGNTTLQAVSVYAVMSDGSYLEVANVPNRLFTPPEGSADLFHNDPAAGPADVLETFADKFRRLIEDHGTMPMQVPDDQHEHLCAYGQARLARARRTAGKRNLIADLMWLADPWQFEPLPAVPGRPWTPEDAPAFTEA